MYSASLGRFLQRDPARFVDGYNIYAYVQNRPVIFFDPMGLAPNRDEDISFSRLKHAVLYWQGQGMRAREVMDAIVKDIEKMDGKKAKESLLQGRYMYSTVYGWLDLKHVASSASHIDAIATNSNYVMRKDFAASVGVNATLIVLGLHFGEQANSNSSTGLRSSMWPDIKLKFKMPPCSLM